MGRVPVKAILSAALALAGALALAAPTEASIGGRERERARLNRDLNRARRDIYRQKHDGQQE